MNRVCILCCLFLVGACSASDQTQRDMTTPPGWGVCTSVSNSDKLKSAGYGYVEESVWRFLMPKKADEAFAKNLEKAQQAPLKVYAYNSFLPGDLKSTGPVTNHDEILAYADTAFRRAQMAGSKIIVFGSGGSRRLPDGFAYEKGTTQFIELLKRMGPIAAKYDITVVIEPLNSGECNFINSVKEGTDIARAVNHPNIAVLADVYHMAKENESPDSIRYAGKLLKHCHLAEKKGRKMPGVNQFDFTPYFKALKEINYHGRVSMEGRWDDFDTQLPEVVAYLNAQWAKAEQGK